VAHELTGAKVRLVPVGPGQVDALARIIEEPAVTRWWRDSGQDLRGWIDQADPAETQFAIVDPANDTVIGYLQVYEELEPDYRHAGIDLFLTTARQGHGLGPDAIRAAVRWLRDERGHHRITIDPAADNVAAIRAYERVGFRPVGVMRRYERGADGTWHDGLLMELLADELR
jgi:aminoglycoside 6'-N-acetyltransferase